MRRIPVIVLLLALVACGSKKKDDGGGAGSADPSATKPVEKPVSCPPGNVVQDGVCFAVMTPEKVAAVGQQQTRLQDLATLLDKVELVAAPVELLNGFRQLEQWKTLAAKSEKLRVLEQVVVVLDASVKKLREFKGSLGEAAVRLGNLKGELNSLLTETTNARRIEEVRTQVSMQVRGAVEPLALEVKETITNALTPLVTQMSDTSDLVITACTMAKLSGGGDKMQELCAQAKSVFAQATVYLDDLKMRPAKLFDEVSTGLERELETLLDAESKKLIDAAQSQVNQALLLPPTTLQAGSAAPGAAP